VRSCRGQGPHRSPWRRHSVHRACRTGPSPPGGEADRGSRRRRRAAQTRPGRPGAVDVPWLASGAGPEPGHELTDGGGRRPWIIRRAGPRQAAKPWERHGRAGRLRFSSPGRGRTWLPGASAPHPGITLSDAGGQGERTRTRRSGVSHGRSGWASRPAPNPLFSASLWLIRVRISRCHFAGDAGKRALPSEPRVITAAGRTRDDACPRQQGRAGQAPEDRA
jgi:hypothetical protein